jgi:hypothetical protein
VKKTIFPLDTKHKMCYNLNVNKGCDQRKKEVDTMTKREFYESIINGTNGTDVVDYAKSALEALNATNAKRAETASAKRATEDAPLIQAIIGVLSSDPKLTTTIAKEVGCTSPKASSILLKLETSGQVRKSEISVKGKGKQKAWALVE